MICDTKSSDLLCVMGVPKGLKREMGQEKICQDIGAENFQNLVKKINYKDISKCNIR